MSYLTPMEGFAAASLLLEDHLVASGKAMVQGAVGEFIPNEKEELKMPIDRATLKIAGQAPITVLEVTQRTDVSAWSFRVE